MKHRLLLSAIFLISVVLYQVPAADAQWNDSAPRLVQSLLVQAFDKSGSIQAATPGSAALRTDLTLSTELRDFEAQYDNANAAPLVVVEGFEGHVSLADAAGFARKQERRLRFALHD